jgi:chorismate mutase
MKVSRKIGALKKKHNVSIVQKARWSEVVADRLKHGKKLGLNLRLIDKIFKEIQKESIAVQKKQRKMK